MKYGGGSPLMDLDGSGGWCLCSAAASVWNDLGPFIKVVPFDLKNALTVSMCGTHPYGWSLFSLEPPLRS